MSRLTTGARELRGVQAFSDLSDGELAWLAAHATFRTLAPGEVLFRQGDPADVMFAVLEGEMRSKREQGASDGRLYVRRSGQIGGMLPYTRITEFPVTARAAVETRLACFAKAIFPELMQRVPVLESRLAAVMADRVRETALHDQQRDKLSSLGKLAAGIAHEINNPAVAIQRSADELARRVAGLGAVVRALMHELEPAASLAGLEALSTTRRTRGAAEHDALEQSDAEEALALWLREREVDEPWLRAEAFVAVGVDADALEEAMRGVGPRLVRHVVPWLEAELASRQLLDDIGGASLRITELVGAVKSFSHLDRTSVRHAVDVRDGIRATVAMLGHRLRQKGVTLRQEHGAEVPSAYGNPGELNQVWANLIDNAIDAVDVGGEIVIRSHVDGAEVVLEVIDDGAGIPSEITWRIFEPFFTTKGVGEGVGIGLDVVRRVVQAHDGDVRVESEPGRTRFEVRLPLAPSDPGTPTS